MLLSREGGVVLPQAPWKVRGLVSSSLLRSGRGMGSASASGMPRDKSGKDSAIKFGDIERERSGLHNRFAGDKRERAWRGTKGSSPRTGEKGRGSKHYFAEDNREGGWLALRRERERRGGSQRRFADEGRGGAWPQRPFAGEGGGGAWHQTLLRRRQERRTVGASIASPRTREKRRAPETLRQLRERGGVAPKGFADNGREGTWLRSRFAEDGRDKPWAQRRFAAGERDKPWAQRRFAYEGRRGA